MRASCPVTPPETGKGNGGKGGQGRASFGSCARRKKGALAGSRRTPAWDTTAVALLFGDFPAAAPSSLCFSLCVFLSRGPPASTKWTGLVVWGTARVGRATAAWTQAALGAAWGKWVR